MKFLARSVMSSGRFLLIYLVFVADVFACEEGYQIITIRRDGTVTANPASVESEARKAGGLKALVERDVADRRTLAEDKSISAATKSAAVPILDKNIRIARCHAALEK
ncbi:hypothetical protein J7U46_20835 [Pelomonas sp. V22]|uniref:hypothetical protein n=1 Tax=Pelomonas sp. V22 TaxID=2822139 RepID=UPI0024A8DD2D|nr:hypothetical protein [Pelomonas sp. V22]MDI4635522.1 hypothetical protein [Pelomonas sp. V22]